MLLPESHQVFVCAQSCLRGVVLSAAELNDSDRFSTITVDEESVLDGNCEEIIIEGITHILEGLPKPVSYTHLDVYKRQGSGSPIRRKSSS